MTDFIMTMEEKIYSKLQKELSPTQLEVINESALHAGHAGDDGSGQSHFRIVIQSDQLDEFNRIQRHRRIHDILKHEMPFIHALSIDFLSD